MQRSIPNKKPLKYLLFVTLFVVYVGLSSIYLFLPPLLGVLFFLFIKSLKNHDTIAILLVAFCLLIFESEKGYFLFNTIIYFWLVYKFVLPKLEQNFNCSICIKLAIILLAYIGFYFFNLLMSTVFLLPLVGISYYIIYYIIVEFLIVNFL